MGEAPEIAGSRPRMAARPKGQADRDCSVLDGREPMGARRIRTALDGHVSVSLLANYCMLFIGVWDILLLDFGWYLKLLGWCIKFGLGVFGEDQLMWECPKFRR